MPIPRSGPCPAPSSSRRTSVPGPASSTIRVIERRWPENVESDWATDCSSPMSAKTSRQIGRLLPAAAGMWRPAWCMRLSRPSVRSVTVLPPVFGTGHHEGGVAVAEPDVDRDGPTGQARMAGRQQDDLGALRGPGPIGVHLGREGRLGAPQVERGEGVEGVAQRLAVDRDQRRQLVEDARDLLLLGGDRLAPGVAELDGHHRLDEQGLAAARGVVDDALDPRAGLGLDRHDVAAVAERHDRLLERAPELRPHQRVESPSQPVVGDPHGRPQATQTR